VGYLGFSHWQYQTVDYTKLEEFLRASQWQSADLETSKLMDRLLVKTVDEQTFFGRSKLDLLGGARYKAFSKINCHDLTSLDQLWVKYSHNRFGFSVQAEILFEIQKEAKLDSSIDQENLFYKRVGWRYISDNSLSAFEYARSEKVEKGYLPSIRWVGDNAPYQKGALGYYQLVFMRLKQCNAM